MNKMIRNFFLILVTSPVKRAMHHRTIQADIHTDRIVIDNTVVVHIQPVYGNFKMQPGGIELALVNRKFAQRAGGRTGDGIADEREIVG